MIQDAIPDGSGRHIAAVDIQTDDGNLLRER
jgi:hypothetical protein